MVFWGPHRNSLWPKKFCYNLFQVKPYFAWTKRGETESWNRCTGTVKVKGRTRILEQMYMDSQSKGENQNPGTDVQGQSE